jgi:hypothetical protein
VHHFESVSPGRFKSDRDNIALYRKRWIESVQPDDLRYYIADGLLGLSYEGTFPIHLRVSLRSSRYWTATRAGRRPRNFWPNAHGKWPI